MNCMGLRLEDNYLTFEGADASTIDPNTTLTVPNSKQNNPNFKTIWN